MFVSELPSRCIFKEWLNEIMPKSDMIEHTMSGKRTWLAASSR